MAYEPTVWNCGDTITADKMNKLEQGLAECCGGGDAGYSCTESYETVYDGNLSFVNADTGYAVGNFESSDILDTETIKVTFDGIDYECARREAMLNDIATNVYGADVDFDTMTIDWSEYPFVITSYDSPTNTIAVETEGTYDVTIQILINSATVSDCFRQAVNEVVGSHPVLMVNTSVDSITNNNVMDKTWQEISDALNSGTICMLHQTSAMGWIGQVGVRTIYPGGGVAVMQYYVSILFCDGNTAEYTTLSSGSQPTSGSIHFDPID